MAEAARHAGSIDDHAEQGQVDISKIQERHDRLMVEMEERGFNHESPLAYEDDIDAGSVDREEHLTVLQERCAACRERITAAGRHHSRKKKKNRDEISPRSSPARSRSDRAESRTRR